MNLAKLAVICLAVVAIDAAAAVGYVASTAPDAVSREVLSHPVLSFDQGALGPHDLADAIQRNFPKIIEQNIAAMTEPEANAWLDQMSDLELEHLAQLYVNANAAAVRGGRLLDVMAHRLDAQRLARLSRFFGSAETFAAVAAWAPHKMNGLSSLAGATYAAPAAGGLLRSPASAQGLVSEAWKPSVLETLREIYQGFRSMRVGAMGATVAIFETTMFAGVALYGAWNVGYAFGTELGRLMQDYAPNFYRDSFVPVVGGSIAKAESYLQSAVKNVNDWRSSIDKLGQYQAKELAKYGVGSTPQKEMAANGGDWDMEAAYENYMKRGGYDPCECDDRDPI